MPQLTCSSCGSRTPSPPGEEGRRPRCRHCGAVLRDEGRSARLWAQTNNRRILLPLLLGGGVFLLCAVVGVVLIVVLGRKGGGPAARATPVTAADLDKIGIYMTPDEVEAILGPGEEADPAEMQENWAAAGKQVGVTRWQVWRNGSDRLFVGYGQGSSGTHRAVVSFFMHDIQNSLGTGFEIKHGFIHMGFPGGDLDEAAREKQKDRELLRSPRWAKGPAIRKALVGQWVAVYVGSYRFNDDGTCRAESPGEKASGTYRFLDDERVELKLKEDPLFEGHQTATKQRKYKVLVDGEELILVDEAFREPRPTVYKRQR